MIALLRTVGHVLIKVDGAADTRLAEVIAKEYEKLKTSRLEFKIYWGFIEEERNILLKEYRFRAHEAARGFGTSLSRTNPTTGELITVRANSSHELYIYWFRDGPFEGRREVDVAADAIQWWRAYLDGIDAQR